MNASVPVSRLRRDFFVYELDFLNLAPGDSATGHIQIQADSDFELQKLTFFAVRLTENASDSLITESSRPLPLASIQITDSGTGRSLFSKPVPIPSIMGDGRIPFILPTTKVFTKNASVVVVVNNFSRITTYDLRLSFIGTKIFAYS